MAQRRSVRIGIDVGGTFTHAVAIDAASLELLGKSKTPTTHRATEGVARGVVDSLLQLLDECSISADEVVLIAHSTTQATNALLEGDVAPVGIIGMGAGPSAFLARRQTNIRPIPLAPGRSLRTSHRYLDSRRLSDEQVHAALDALVAAGAQVIVAAEAFSVDDATHEALVCRLASERGLPVTATHHVSRMHGLGIRTRTAVINASMIPTMLATADMTEQAVRDAGMRAPLLIMRSDGGVMDIQEMRRRPILTMLSGPAAGVAAALLFARVSDGVFLEVGGTSTDISVIKDGRCQIRSAEIGGQKLHVDTLDVRTVGVAGGSLVYLKGDAIADVGPRSSHIAALRYLSFADASPGALRAARVEHDGAQHLTVAAGDEHFAVTPTCASNLLGLVKPEHTAFGREAVIHAGFQTLARQRGAASPEVLATEVMNHAAPKVVRLVEGLLKNYKLDPGLVRLIGGGGGAAAIVPYVAQQTNLPHAIAEHADVISAIGVALALVRDTVERTVVEPSEDDIRRIRQEALESVQKMGAAPETIQVHVEVDAKRNLLRATAEGSTEIRAQDPRPAASTRNARAALAAQSISHALASPQCAAQGAGFEVWTAPRRMKRLWVLSETRQAVRVIDTSGTIRWGSNHGDVRESTVATAESDFLPFVERYTQYNDAGAVLPRCFVLLGGQIIDLSGLVTIEQVLELLRIELKRHGARDACILLIDRAS